ncbi:hypothetical protein NMG60_11007795 [Bertholletia excelsa]
MMPSALLKPQTRELFSLLPTFPLSLHSPRGRYTFRTLTISRTSTRLSNSSSLSCSTKFSLESRPHQYSDEDDNEELVIGDCVIFEEGAFEDPCLAQDFDSDVSNVRKSKKSVEVRPENLIPEQWKDIQAEINITKKERRRIARELEYGRRVEKRKQELAPIRSVKVADYVAYRDKKLSQLKPLVLDNPSFPVATEEKDAGEARGSETNNSTSSGRVAPRNPRLAVYGGTLDDITEFFNSGNYDPSAAKKTEGPRKLFTKEEKVLLNKRIPDIASATSGKWLPLHTLTASGEFYLVNALLKHNVDINIQDKDGLTAIHKAILSKKQAIFNYLLRESANPFVRDKEGATLMHYAVRAASNQMIKILLLYNVDINLQDNDGWTPLHLAVQTRRTDIVRLLLIKGADKTIKNQDGLTPLGLCLLLGQDTRTYELIKLLKELPKT